MRIKEEETHLILHEHDDDETYGKVGIGKHLFDTFTI
jgi:hypothetical protein